MDGVSDFRKLWLLLRLRRNVWRKTEELLKIQEKKLRAIVKHAYYNVEYYHRQFNSLGLKTGDIKTVEDLQKLPIITRDEVQKHNHELISRNVEIGKCKDHVTSGTTGKRITLYTDAYAEDYRSAVFGRAFLECGLGIRDRIATISTSTTFPKTKTWFRRLGFADRMYIDARENPEKKISSLVKYDPDGIFGYSSYIYLLARTVKDLGVTQLSPKLVVGTAEVLDKRVRDFVEFAFNVKMLDFFGCIEMERTAWQCLEQDGYHMDIDSVVMEFVKDGKSVGIGEKGEIVYTCLYNYAMPLIRYNIEDVGILSDEKCPCGRGLPLMKSVEGRLIDFIPTKSGRILSPLGLANAVWSIRGWADYQIIQESLDKFTIRLVKGKEFPSDGASKIYYLMKEIIGDDVHVQVDFVDKIPKDRSGKRHAIISKVGYSYLKTKEL
jgi:phenylacetate-CoA ligase